MAIDTSAAAAAAASGGSATAQGHKRLAENYETFLTLLTTQMKNQDPLSPLDSNQFTQQIVSMTGVEQQLLTNDLLQKMVAANSATPAGAVGMIGKLVRAGSDTASLSGGKADWVYNLGTDAANVKIEVLDAKGGVLHASSGVDNSAGDHAFSWDGRDLSDRQLPDGGAYTLRVTADDSAGKAVTVKNYVEGVVSAVEQQNGQILLSVGGGKVAWDKVIRVAQDPSAASGV